MGVDSPAHPRSVIYGLGGPGKIVTKVIRSAEIERLYGETERCSKQSP